MKKRPNIKAWREFEHLVEMIERYLSPKGAIIKSPDFIPDIVSGDLREVDISIRYNVGSVPILIIFECRMRKKRAGIDWIEQIRTKRDDIHANSAIAVSISGFTKTAIVKAKSHRIGTRILKDITEEEIEKWSKSFKMFLIQEFFEIKRINFGYPKQLENKAHEIISAIQASKLDIKTKFLKKTKDGKLQSIQDYIFQYQKDKGMKFDENDRSLSDFKIELKESFKGKIPVSNKYPALFDELKSIGQKQTIYFREDFESEEVAVSSLIGDVIINWVEIEFEVWKEIYPLVFSQITTYLNDGNQIVSVGKGEISLGNSGRIEIITTKSFIPKKE